MLFLHFGEEPSFQDDRISKIKFLLSHLMNNRVTGIYTPQKELSIDESMMLRQERLVFRQYINIKETNIEESSLNLYTNDGFVLRTDVYPGLKFADPESFRQTAAVVLHRIEPYLHKGYHVFADNWYTSVPLTKYLTKQKTYIVTLRADRKHTPEE